MTFSLGREKRKKRQTILMTFLTLPIGFGYCNRGLLDSPSLIVCLLPFSFDCSGSRTADGSEAAAPLIYPEISIVDIAPRRKVVWVWICVSELRRRERKSAHSSFGLILKATASNPLSHKRAHSGYYI